MLPRANSRVFEIRRRSTSASESPTAILTTGGLRRRSRVRGSGRPRTERTLVGPMTPSATRAARRTEFLQLVRVARPVVRLEDVEGVGVECERRVDLLEKAAGEERDVAFALAQGRQMHRLVGERARGAASGRRPASSASRGSSSMPITNRVAHGAATARQQGLLERRGRGLDVRQKEGPQARSGARRAREAPPRRCRRSVRRRGGRGGEQRERRGVLLGADARPSAGPRRWTPRRARSTPSRPSHRGERPGSAFAQLGADELRSRVASFSESRRRSVWPPPHGAGRRGRRRPAATGSRARRRRCRDRAPRRRRARRRSAPEPSERRHSIQAVGRPARVERRDDDVGLETGDGPLGLERLGEHPHRRAGGGETLPQGVAGRGVGVEDEDFHRERRILHPAAAPPRSARRSGRIPRDGQRASIFFRTSSLMTISSGQRRSNPSSFHLRVASMPILLP